MNDEQFRKKLTPEQYRVLRGSATEAPFSGEYLDMHEDGTYSCAACDAVLFSSAAKFDSGSGWPSFYEAADAGAITLREDTSHGMTRTEAVCASCGSHLGHVFEDAGDQPTGTRYCINSLALQFTKDGAGKK